MKKHLLRFEGVRISVPIAWRDITDEMDVPEAPFTFADKSKDIGALQFSIARYVSGEVPNPSPEDLLALAEELAASLGLSDAHDKITEGGAALRLGAVSYRDGEYFMRIWCVSDGKNFAKVTYACAWGLQSEQMEECEAIVRSLRFS